MDILRKLSHQVLSALIPGNPYYQSCHQMICSFRQGLVLSLGLSCESKSLFLEEWQHKDRSAVSEKDLSNEIEENPYRGAFPNRRNLQVSRSSSPESTL